MCQMVSLGVGGHSVFPVSRLSPGDSQHKHSSVSSQMETLGSVLVQHRSWNDDLTFNGFLSCSGLVLFSFNIFFASASLPHNERFM